MARVFITGSSDGLGRMAARLLVKQGHAVVLHARNDARRRDALAAVPGAEAAVIGDLASITQTRGVADLRRPVTAARLWVMPDPIAV